MDAPGDTDDLSKLGGFLRILDRQPMVLHSQPRAVSGDGSTVGGVQTMSVEQVVQLTRDAAARAAKVLYEDGPASRSEVGTSAAAGATKEGARTLV